MHFIRILYFWYVIKVVLNIQIFVKCPIPPAFINRSEWVRLFCICGLGLQRATSKSESLLSIFLSFSLGISTWWETGCIREHLGKVPGMGLIGKLTCACRDQRSRGVPFCLSFWSRVCAHRLSPAPSVKGRWLVGWHNPGAGRLLTPNTQIEVSVVRPRECWAGHRALVWFSIESIPHCAAS